jgi:hypothetical protein
LPFADSQSRLLAAFSRYNIFIKLLQQEVVIRNSFCIAYYSGIEREEYITMSHQGKEQVVTGNKLLTLKERAICEQITTHKAPHSQRALALLALDEKRTQALAAEQAGLSAGQVKYLAAQFRKLRMGVFPTALLEDLSEINDESRTDSEKKESTKDNTKGKKDKKLSKSEKRARKAEKRAAKKARKRAARKAAKKARKAVEKAKRALKEAKKAAKKAEMKARRLNKG